jgi:hypothetical protein
MFSLSATIGACSTSGTTSTDDNTTDEDLTSSSGGGFFVGHGVDGDGIKVGLANRATTACPSHGSQPVCSVKSVDFSALGLPADGMSSLQSAFAAGHAIVQGKLVQSGPLLGTPVPVAILVATSVWLGAVAKDAASTDSYLVVNDLIMQACTGEQCARMSEKLLNKNAAVVEITAADLGQVGASAVQ